MSTSENRGTRRRVWAAVSGAVGIGLIGALGFNFGAGINPYGTRVGVVTVGALLSVLGAGLAPAAIYLIARAGGWRAGAAVGAAIVAPAAWYLKEIVRMSEYLSGGLLAYGALHQVYLAVWAWIAVLLGGTELIRRLRASSGATGSAATRSGAVPTDAGGRPGRRGVAGPVVAVVIGLVGLLLFVGVQGGVLYAQWYMAGYAALFQ